MKISSEIIEEIVKKASNIIITAHKNIDLDALGAMLGFYYVASKFDKEALILLEDEKYEPGVETALVNIKKLEHNIPIKVLSEIDINKDSLLVIIDTNKNNRLQNEAIFDKVKNKIVIDHHIKENINESDYIYTYINTDESSSSEIITDILMDLNIYIPKYIASIMLGGIMVDTNRFYLKTTKNTFEAAGVLKKMGASNKDIQYLFKQDFNDYVIRQEIIMTSEFIGNNILLAVANETKIFDNDELAKAADAMLTFDHVEASFVIGHISKDEIGISARSLGKIDVHKIMKVLNGGGHKTESATQIKEKSIKEIRDILIEVLKK